MAEPQISRRSLSRRVCRWLDWRSNNGEWQEGGCRKALVELERRQVLKFPLSRVAFGPRQTPALAVTATEVGTTLKALGPVELIAIGAHRGHMGRPYPGHEVEAIDESGNPVPRGQQGELAARTGDPVMFLGYWNDVAATAEKITNGWFRTGDVGYLDDDGYIWFLGRKDDVISTAGHRVGPGEIEDSLLRHPAVAQAAVIGSPDELRGSIIKAFIVLAQGHVGSEDLKDEIRQFVKVRLAAHEYPRAIEFIEEMPMTTTGKVRRVDLRKM